MKRTRQSRGSIRQESQWILACISSLRLLLTIVAISAATAWSQTLDIRDTENANSPPLAEGESMRGHGSFSITYLNTYVNGFWLDSNTKEAIGPERSLGVALDFDYYVADAWSVHVGIPYLSNKYTGPQPHCPTTAPPQCAPGNPQYQNIPVLNPPHPESQFIDDGKYHSTWQDFSLGAAWHTDVNGYLITPSVTAVIPSHDYVFFDNAAVGQRLHQLVLAGLLEHQFEFTNIYYRLGYGYAFSQHVTAYDSNNVAYRFNTGYQRFGGELGYFINPKLSVRALLSGRIGNGASAGEILPLAAGQTDDIWYHHDQISEHTYFGAGLGFDYNLNDHYSLTADIQREFFGELVFNFKYAFELKLSRGF